MVELKNGAPVEIGESAEVAFTVAVPYRKRESSGSSPPALVRP
jgi:hypothetical protein